MIWQLVRRDAAWRWMPWLLLGSAVACLLWHAAPDARDFGGPALAYCVFSLTPSYASNRQMRDVYFQASLPIGVRQIYLSRTLSMLALVGLPILTGVVFGKVTGRRGFTLTLVDYGSLFFAAIMAIQSAVIQCRLRKPGIRAYNLFWLCGIGVCAISGLPQWLLRQGAATALAFPLVCWMVSGGIFASTWRALPKSFDFGVNILPAADADEVRLRGTTWAQRWRAFCRVSSLHWSGTVTYLIIGMFWASKWFADAWFMPWFALVVPMVALIVSTRWLGSLPVSPRTWMACGLLPALVVTCAGYVLGLHIPWLADVEQRGVTVTASADGNDLANISNACKMFDVIPPDDYLIPAPADHVPLIRAPWGETFQPGTNPVDGFDVYNPYASGCDNSERFLDWQFARATAAVYGRPIPRDRRAGSYVVASELGVPPVRQQLISAGLRCGCLITFLFLALMQYWWRLPLIKRTSRAIVVLVVALPLLAVFIFFGDVSQWLYWALPANPFDAGAMILAVLVGIYLLVEAMYGQSEYLRKQARAA